MTEEQVEELICEHLSQFGMIGMIGDLEELRKNLNSNVLPKGWIIESIKGVGMGYVFKVKPTDHGVVPTGPVVSNSPVAASVGGGGVRCKKCGTFNPYLDTPNQPDGTHICYSCRS